MQHNDVARVPTLPEESAVTPGYETEKPTYEDEKKGQQYTQTTLDIQTVDDHYIPGDPLPLDASLPEEDSQLTLRAVIVGVGLGALVSGSNTYLGLKTGFTFGPQLLGGIGGFLILKPLSKVIPQTLPAWFGVGHFGPRENVACQTAATAAGGLSAMTVAGFPAMYQLGLLGAKPSDDFGKLLGFGFAVAFYGMTFAIPLRSFFILRQRLVFPTPTATAYAIRSLHSTGSGAEDAKRKGKWIAYSFLAAFLQKIASTYAPGILYDWHFFYWIATWGAPRAQYLDNWGWLYELTPAFWGAGILSGVNASVSFYLGSIFAWGIIGPALIATGRAVGRNTEIEGSNIPYRNYNSMTPKYPTTTETSPRYNLLWLGVLMMIVCAFVELAVEWRVIAAGFSPMVMAIRNKLRVRKGLEPIEAKQKPLTDPAPKKDQVPWYVWVGMTAVASVLTCVIMGVLYKVNVGLSILGLVLAFIFCFIGVLGAGVTDINPITACAKAAQLVCGGATAGKYAIDPVTGLNTHAMNVNLLVGMVAGSAAGQAVDMTGDLKTGHLIGAKPVAQYWAQFCGAIASVFLCFGFFVLFTAGSPCIIDLDADECQYLVPSATAWRAVAIAVTSNKLPVPTTSGILAITFSVGGALIIIFRAMFCPQKYKGYVINPSAFALAFVLPQTTYGAAMVTGALGAWLWKRKRPEQYEAAAYALAAGMLTGEGLGGVVQAILYVANAGLDKISGIGCPGGSC